MIYQNIKVCETCIHDRPNAESEPCNCGPNTELWEPSTDMIAWALDYSSSNWFERSYDEDEDDGGMPRFGPPGLLNDHVDEPEPCYEKVVFPNEDTDCRWNSTTETTVPKEDDDDEDEYKHSWFKTIRAIPETLALAMNKILDRDGVCTVDYIGQVGPYCYLVEITSN